MAGLKMDYINVSAGIPGETSEITRPVPQGKWFYLHHIRYAKTAMETVAAPLPPSQVRPRIVQSGYSILKGEALALAEECISKGYSDFAGFGRQIFADPETPAKLLRGEEPNWCIGCSGCTKLMVKQVNDGCSVYDEYYKSLLKNQGGA
jgi:2,4-dienoyl-CoA reductase-like NADH-dependent reductase (Old Yellow Enzyme family)